MSKMELIAGAPWTTGSFGEVDAVGGGAAVAVLSQIALVLTSRGLWKGEKYDGWPRVSNTSSERPRLSKAFLVASESV